MTQPTATAPSIIQPWKTIKLGTFKSADHFFTALNKNDNLIGERASEILSKPAFTVAHKETEVHLVIVSAADLGFGDGADYEHICARGTELGLALCPAEVGPQLRLQYNEQLYDECLRIAMEGITDSDGDSWIFTVALAGNRSWLLTTFASPHCFWYGPCRFVFIAR